MNKKIYSVKILFTLLLLCTVTFVQAKIIKLVDRGEEVTLSATEGYDTYQWQVSSDNKFYTNLPAATNADYIFKASAPSYYRVKATLGNNSAIFIDSTQITFTEITYIEEGRKIPASRGYVEVDGQKGSGINIPEGTTVDAESLYGEDGKTVEPILKLTNWTNKDAHAVWYTYLHKSKFDVNLLLTTNFSKNYVFHLIVTDPNDPNNPIADNYLSFNGSFGELSIPAASMNITGARYYRYDLECIEGNENITSINGWQYNYNVDGDVYPQAIMGSPSVHLWWSSSDYSKPYGNSFDWCYEEVMIPASSDISGTYCEALGVLRGYMGIQCNGEGRHDVIFSMWDDGSTEEDPDLVGYKRAGAVDASSIVSVSRFGGEGTGVKTFAAGDYWTPGTYVRFLTNARPEQVECKVVENGETKTIIYKNTLVSAWFDANDGKGWQYLATTRLPGNDHYFGSWYSFLEDYNGSTGQLVRKAYYRNGYTHSLSGDKWYHCNQTSFTHTDGGSEIGGRRDYSQKIAPDDATAFTMQTGGFLDTYQGTNKVALDENKDPIKDIDIDLLLMRVDRALENETKRIEDEENMAENFYDKTDWEVIDFSSQEVSGEGSNGRAALIIDGDEDTYWHSQWQGGAAQFPHYFVIDMKHIQPINGMQYILSGGTSRYMKAVELYASNDNKNWHEIYNTDASEDAASFYVPLDSIVYTRYFKINITDDWNDDVFTRINEINVTHPSSYDPTSIQSVSMSKGSLNISLSSDFSFLNVVVPTNAPEMVVELYNTSGVKLSTTTFYNQTKNEVKTIRLPFLCVGIYVVRVRTNKGQYSSSIMIH